MIHHVSIPARNPEHVARVLAELFQGYAGPFIGPMAGPWVVYQEDGFGTGIEVYDERTILAPGAHINAVGACFAQARELDTTAVVRSRLYVDRRESALAESGDVLIPISEGAFEADHIVGELGDLLLRRVPGRTAAREITLFKSLGIAIEDLAAAHHVMQRAATQGVGTVAPLGEFLPEHA